MQVIIFQKKLYAYHLDDQVKNIYYLSSHRATKELYAKVPSHSAPVGALCEGSSMRLYNARCTETLPALYILEIILVLSVIIKRMYVFVSEDHMLDWHSCQICYPLEIKLLLLIANNILEITKMFFRVLKLKPLTHKLCFFFYDMSSKLDPVKWRGESQSFLRYMSL